ncbi:MAG: flavodoxin family protein [Thermodesulfobacteriota bacterium]|jgi:multimeric flavodoxin WrbA
MKVLGLSCSPRRHGNTEILLGEALQGAKQEGAEVELYCVSEKDIRSCDGCGACHETGECHIKDDMQILYDKLLGADGILFGTPVYFYSMTAQAKTVIDRTVSLNRPERSLANKVGGVIAVAGSLGLIDAVKDLYFYMVTRQMLPANFVAAYAGAKGEVRKMEQCMKATQELGRQMVQIAAKKFEYPKEFRRASFGYGTHTH